VVISSLFNLSSTEENPSVVLDEIAKEIVEGRN
jgi:hypothetical protein